MDLQEIREKLKKIPHLLLGKIEISNILNEISDIQYFDYRKPGEDQEKNKLYADSWKVTGLIDYSEDPSGASEDRRPFRSNIDYTEKKLMITTLGKKMPSSIQAIYSLVEKPMRARISKFVPGGHLLWHSHCQFYTNNYKNTEYNIGVLHIPLITNKNVKFGVTKYPVEQHGINPVWQYYDVGEVWLFNSWHQHNVYNEGDTDRIHILFYFSLFDNKIRPIIERAIKQYNGKYID